MGAKHNFRRDRQLVLVAQLRKGDSVTLEGFSAYLDRHVPRLRASKKTVQRDVEDLRNRMGAPIIYSPKQRSLKLDDPQWQLPMDVGGEGLIATLMCMRIAAPPPMPSIEALQEAVHANLSAADPHVLDLGMLDSLVHATTRTPALRPDICATVETAWRERRCCRIRYTAADRKTSTRTIDVHGIFLADGAWYIRAWCCSQNAARSFALHRLQGADLLDDHFDPRPQLVESISRGEVFDDTAVAGVIVHCSPEKAPLIREREWFPGQTLRDLPDGAIELHFPNGPRQRIVWWVLAYAGTLTVLQPAELRREVAEIAGAIHRQHREVSP